MRVRVEVSGLEEIRNALAEGGKKTADKAKAVLAERADVVVALARPNVPLETDPRSKDVPGALRDSLRRTRPSYMKSSGRVTCSIVLGGDPLLSATRRGRRLNNVYAVLQEFDIGRGAPYDHADGQSHAVGNAVESVAPTIPDMLLEAFEPADLGGA